MVYNEYILLCWATYKEEMVLPAQTQTEMKVKLVLAVEAVQAGKKKTAKCWLKTALGYVRRVEGATSF